MDLSVDWPSSAVRISPDCHDTVASTATPPSGGGDVAPSSNASHAFIIPSDVYDHFITEEIIRLKFNIATQRGRQDEVQLQWHKLIQERTALQFEMETIERECDTLQTETSMTNDRIEQSSIRLRQLTSTISPEQQRIDQATNDFNAINSELQSLQLEKSSIQDASKYLSEEIEGYKRQAAQLSSEISEIDIERIAVQFDIGDLHEAITKAKAASQEHKSTTDKLEADIACVKAECDKLGKHNHGLETKIAGSTG
jgi:chromosome segregation ATPase